MSILQIRKLRLREREQVEDRKRLSWHSCGRGWDSPLQCLSSGPQAWLCPWGQKDIKPLGKTTALTVQAAECSLGQRENPRPRKYLLARPPRMQACMVAPLACSLSTLLAIICSPPHPHGLAQERRLAAAPTSTSFALGGRVQRPPPQNQAGEHGVSGPVRLDT